jgi:hypothetical protein
MHCSQTRRSASIRAIISSWFLGTIVIALSVTATISTLPSFPLSAIPINEQRHR